MFLFLFLPITWIGFQLFKSREGGGQSWLLLASLIFYGAWDWRFLPLLVVSTVLNYLVGEQLLRRPSRGLLTLGVAANLGAIAWWKYADFGIETFNMLADSNFGLLALTLPLGISFFTFQQIAYLVDCHQSKAERSNFREYALFVTFFPQLIAGPIVHHSEMLSQFRQRPLISDELFAKGILLLVAGLAKKVIIADSLAPWVDAGFGDPGAITLLDAWTSTLAYTFQLYFDFSGYSEMAMGLACLFGYTLPVNFLSPYKASNIADFWRRWHITLGRFLRQYLYIPLGGSRHGTARTMLALSLTMLLGGLWHGAGWTFVAWGALHGAFLSVYYGWAQLGIRLPVALGRAITFVAVVFAWVPFRADSMADALAVWRGMLGLNGFDAPPLIARILGDIGVTVPAVRGDFAGWEIAVLLFGIALVMQQPNVHDRWASFKPDWRTLAATATAAIAAIAIIGRDSAWLYGAF